MPSPSLPYPHPLFRRPVAAEAAGAQAGSPPPSLPGLAPTSEGEVSPESQYPEIENGTHGKKTWVENQTDFFEEETAVIVTRKGELILVSAADYEDLNRFTWCIHRRGKGYAQTMMKVADGKKRLVMMHRYLMRAPRWMQVDHRDGKPLNNTRENIRLATNGQNMANRGRMSTARTRYKGVYQNVNRLKRYRVRLTKDKKVYWSCSFHYAASAAIGYNIMSRYFFGEFARGNVVEEIV